MAHDKHSKLLLLFLQKMQHRFYYLAFIFFFITMKVSFVDLRKLKGKQT